MAFNLYVGAVGGVDIVAHSALRALICATWKPGDEETSCEARDDNVNDELILMR